ncbi:MAG: hypothetical protein K0S27_457 [Gammaproteobacteria bacterium]|jgi:hypothetical protein|nr:hypothetical protein [Gammaproteobacteria bacterium]
MKKINHLFFCLLLTYIFIYRINAMAGDKSEIISTPENIAVPHTTYPLLYTIHASEGELIEDKRKNFRLMLEGVHEGVAYQFSTPRKLNGIVELKGFIKMWNSKRLKRVEVDVTGLQRNDQTLGHDQLYLRARVRGPQYADSKGNKLIFFLSDVSPPVKINNILHMKNVSLFLNGCDICSCKPTGYSCL